MDKVAITYPRYLRALFEHVELDLLLAALAAGCTGSKARRYREHKPGVRRRLASLELLSSSTPPHSFSFS